MSSAPIHLGSGEVAPRASRGRGGARSPPREPNPAGAQNQSAQYSEAGEASDRPPPAPCTPRWRASCEGRPMGRASPLQIWELALGPLAQSDHPVPGPVGCSRQALTRHPAGASPFRRGRVPKWQEGLAPRAGIWALREALVQPGERVSHSVASGNHPGSVPGALASGWSRR